MRAPSDFLNVTVQPLWDTQTIPAAGVALLTYFTQPVGQGVTNFAAAGARTLADTNMRAGGFLPAGYNFVLLGFRVQPAFTLTAQDAGRWSIGGVLTFTVSSVPFLEVPLDSVPAGMGPSGSVATSAIFALSHGWPSLSNSFNIGKKPLELSQSQDFSLTLTWPSGGIAVTSTVPAQPVAGLPVRVYMDGFRKKIIVG